jgi:hypothetical protein
MAEMAHRDLCLLTEPLGDQGAVAGPGVALDAEQGGAAVGDQLDQGR